MVQVEMIDDVRKLEKKTMGPFTTRQFICIAIAAAYSIPIAVILPVGIAAKIIVGFMLAIPVAICGWVTLNKEPFEIVAIRFIYKHFLTPQKRKCKVISEYRKTLKKIRNEQEQEKIADLNAKERKKYEENKKAIKYSSNEEFKVYR